MMIFCIVPLCFIINYDGTVILVGYRLNTSGVEVRIRIGVGVSVSVQVTFRVGVAAMVGVVGRVWVEKLKNTKKLKIK